MTKEFSLNCKNQINKSRAYVCARMIVENGKIILSDAGIYSESASSLTTFHAREAYFEVLSSEGDSFQEAHDNAFKVLQALKDISPIHRKIHDIIISGQDIVTAKY